MLYRIVLKPLAYLLLLLLLILLFGLAYRSYNRGQEACFMI